VGSEVARVGQTCQLLLLARASHSVVRARA
jgi:hypothetical protein